MGEEPSRVYIVGAPGLDEILNTKLYDKKEIEKKYHLDLSKPFLLVTQHPVTAEVLESSRQMKETMEAVKETGYQMVVIYPNADAGGRKIIKIIKRYVNCPFIQIHKSLPRKDYLSLMKYADVLIGNSSSGIIEAPSFHLPVVNIGIRQEGRERADNIIDVDYKKEQILKAIKKALNDKNFKKKIKECRNPYGDGKTGLRIANILSKIKITQGLLQKKLVY